MRGWSKRVAYLCNLLNQKARSIAMTMRGMRMVMMVTKTMANEEEEEEEEEDDDDELQNAAKILGEACSERWLAFSA